MKFTPVPRKPAPPDVSVRPSAPLRTAVGNHYPSGYSDADVERFASEDGNASVHDPAMWGANTSPRIVDVLNAGHDSTVSLIAHRLREDSQEIVQRIEAAVPQARTAEQATLTALDTERAASIALLMLRYTITGAGLALPSKQAWWRLAVPLFLLFVGDWAIVTVAFQVFGLSDRPWLPGVGFTDDLHLAALTSVLLLVFLAHGAGDKLRRVAHTCERRRLVRDQEVRNTLPRPSLIDLAIIVVCLLVALWVLVGLGTIRANYLLTQGIPAETTPFLALQIGVLTAALYLSFRHAHSYAEEWTETERRLLETRRSRAEAQHAFDTLVGSINADIDLLDAFLAQAGHHAQVDESNVRRQASLYVRRDILSQPEPTEEQLFPDALPAPTSAEPDGLTARLLGVTAMPTFSKLDPEPVVTRQQDIRDELRELEDRLRQRQLDGLLEPKENSSGPDPATTEIRPPLELGTPLAGSSEEAA